MAQEYYARENKAAACSCPRQCRYLSYQSDISQALMSDYIINYLMSVKQPNSTLEEYRYDHVALEVSQRTGGSSSPTDTFDSHISF